MKRIDDLFFVHRACSDLYHRYKTGPVPYVGNGLADNAVVGLVTPLAGDRVFQCRAIALSSFCEATVQIPPFVACGRAGNGLVVLEPKEQMTAAQLAYFAAYINLAVRWRFNWYRQTTATRVQSILVPDKAPPDIVFDVRAAVPELTAGKQRQWKLKLDRFALDYLFELVPGDYHSLAALPPGRVPVVSCGDQDNGISGYYEVAAPLYAGKMTIAFNGMNTLTAKYHPYRFAAKDDVAVCTPRTPLRLTTILFVQVMLNRERWRYSYFRKCFLDKLKRLTVPLPAKDGEIDEGTIQAIVESSPHWHALQARLA